MTSDPGFDRQLQKLLHDVLDRESGPHAAWIDSPAARTVADPMRRRARRWPLRMLAVAAILLIGAGALIAGGWLSERPPRIGGFAPGPTLTHPRLGHTATLLQDGRFLIAGGSNQREAELLDPDGGPEPAGTLLGDVADGTATLLSDGRVLVVGAGESVTAELWDPRTLRFEAAGILPGRRDLHTATLLSDGRVLIAGGLDDGGGQSALLSWDPTSRSFSEVGALRRPRWNHTATRLRDGRVLVVGGADPCSGATAEIVSPDGQSTMLTGSPVEALGGRTATLLDDGRVLTAGGTVPGGTGPGTTIATAELWDPSTGTFSRTGSMNDARADHTATLLPDGRVLVIGGFHNSDLRGSLDLATSEIWDPASGTFSPSGSLTEARWGHTSSLLTDGRVIVIASWMRSGPHDTTEIWDADLDGSVASPSAVPGTPAPAATPPPVASEPSGGAESSPPAPTCPS